MATILMAGTALPSFAAVRHTNRVKPHATTARDYRSSQRVETQRDTRSFWQKHRNKLTVGAGVVGGAIVGGLIGGKRGAGIGMLAGGASSALYTYKLRKKSHSY